MLQRNEMKTVLGGDGEFHIDFGGNGSGGKCPPETPVACKCLGSPVVNCKLTQEDCDYTCNN